jgi:hypothetical protein
MTMLRMAFDRSSGRRITEVYDDRGEFIAAIYPTADGSNSVHIVSNYFADDPVNPSEGIIPVEGYQVRFRSKS